MGERTTHDLQPGRTIAATVLGALVGGLGLALVVGYASEALLEAGGDGPAALLYTMIGLMMGATLAPQWRWRSCSATRRAASAASPC